MTYSLRKDSWPLNQQFLSFQLKHLTALNTFMVITIPIATLITLNWLAEKFHIPVFLTHNLTILLVSIKDSWCYCIFFLNFIQKIVIYQPVMTIYLTFWANVWENKREVGEEKDIKEKFLIFLWNLLSYFSIEQYSLFLIFVHLDSWAKKLFG